MICCLKVDNNMSSTLGQLSTYSLGRIHEKTSIASGSADTCIFGCFVWTFNMLFLQEPTVMVWLSTGPIDWTEAQQRCQTDMFVSFPVYLKSSYKAALSVLFRAARIKPVSTRGQNCISFYPYNQLYTTSHWYCTDVLISNKSHKPRSIGSDWGYWDS